MEKKNVIEQVFAVDVFNDAVMKERLPKPYLFQQNIYFTVIFCFFIIFCPLASFIVIVIKTSPFFFAVIIP